MEYDFKSHTIYLPTMFLLSNKQPSSLSLSLEFGLDAKHNVGFQFRITNIIS